MRAAQIPCLRDVCRLDRFVFLDGIAPPRIVHSITGAISLSLSFHPIPLCSPGYSDEKIARLTKEAIQAGFNHFKMKVGADRADDLRRGRLIRSIIDDPQSYPTDDPESARRVPDGPALAGKNAGPTGAVLMIDANQVWDVPQAIDYVSSLAEIKPWCAHVLFSFPLFSSRVFS